MKVYKEVIGESVSQKLEMTARIISNRIKNDDFIYNRIKEKAFELEKSEQDIEKKRKIAKMELDMLKTILKTRKKEMWYKFVTVPVHGIIAILSIKLQGLTVLGRLTIYTFVRILPTEEMRMPLM